MYPLQAPDPAVYRKCKAPISRESHVKVTKPKGSRRWLAITLNPGAIPTDCTVSRRSLSLLCRFIQCELNISQVDRINQLTEMPISKKERENFTKNLCGLSQLNQNVLHKLLVVLTDEGLWPADSVGHGGEVAHPASVSAINTIVAETLETNRGTYC